jgi:hypothetical protein
MADVQVAAEYVVNAIRTMSPRAGRKISIVGHSQGGMIPRWPLRFWPDTRALVDDVIGLAPSNHGTETANFTCNPDCAPAAHQQAAGSEFITALNSIQETFAGISYTSIYTYTDAVVTPNLNDDGSSSLHTGDGAITNVAIQEVCPSDPNDHLGIGTVSNTAYSIALDALQNPGPADETRLDPATVCASPMMPGVNPATFATDAAQAAAALGQVYATYPGVAAEPPLACYVTVSCADTAGGPAQADKPKKKSKKRKKKKRKKKKKKKRR